MKKNDIKRVIGKIESDKGIEYRLSKKIHKKQNRKGIFMPFLSIASIVILVCIGILGVNFFKKYDKPIDNTPDTPLHSANSAAISIPKLELPNSSSSNAMFDMIGLIVYQGRIYTQTGTKINPGSAENLIEEKLGTTKDNINEWSKQDDYVEFASTIGVQDVYSVKGYDKNFRIMTNGELHNAQFYECLNGITVKTGADIFNKLKIENNIKTAKYEAYESWNYSKQQYKEMGDLKTLNNFVGELKNTIPYKQESMPKMFEDSENQKFIYISLSDGSEVQLRLFKNGYIYYDSVPVFLKMENKVFNELWDELL